MSKGQNNGTEEKQMEDVGHETITQEKDKSGNKGRNNEDTHETTP